MHPCDTLTGVRAVTPEFLAEHRRDRLEVVTDRLGETIQRDNAGYRHAGVVPLADLRQSCHDNVARVLELLAEAVEVGTVTPRGDREPAYDAARATGRRRAEQGLPLDDVLRSFRIGGRLIWADLVEVGEDALDARELREIGTWLWEVVDETSAQVARSYHQHERALVRADEQQRAELWEGLLHGRAHDPGFARDAGSRLDVPVDGPLLVVCAADLDPVAADLAVSPHASAWVRRTAEVVGLVALRRRSPDGPDEAYVALARLAERDAVPLGVSGVVPGLAGVDEGHRQAALALRAQGTTVGVAGFDQRLAEALLLSAPDVGRRLRALWVDPLLALPGGEGEALVATLDAWVAGGGSATAAARAAHCHRNTVLNRLRRVAAVAGRDVPDGCPPVELDLALRAHRLGL
ncbi:MAG: hypothetical protein CMH83_20365 [Nocardioides sp.]|nr:hypothetical protein [Nocardioides sp.]